MWRNFKENPPKQIVTYTLREVRREIGADEKRHQEKWTRSETRGKNARKPRQSRLGPEGGPRREGTESQRREKQKNVVRNPSEGQNKSKRRTHGRETQQAEKPIGKSQSEW